jgi:hypothetical protein
MDARQAFRGANETTERRQWFRSSKAPQANSHFVYTLDKVPLSDFGSSILRAARAPPSAALDLNEALPI